MPLALVQVPLALVQVPLERVQVPLERVQVPLELGAAGKFEHAHCSCLKFMKFEFRRMHACAGLENTRYIGAIKNDVSWCCRTYNNRQFGCRQNECTLVGWEARGGEFDKITREWGETRRKLTDYLFRQVDQSITRGGEHSAVSAKVALRH